MELACDRPEDQWPRDADGNLAMVTQPLDVEGCWPARRPQGVVLGLETPPLAVAPSHRTASDSAEIESGTHGGFGQRLLGATAILVYLALAKLLLHLFTADSYGYFRDELYYVAAGEHLDLGYVDFPPFVAVVAAATRAFRRLAPGPARLSGAGGRRRGRSGGTHRPRAGGGRFAQGLAALATLIPPTLLVFGTWLSMDAFDQLFWVLGSYVLVLILRYDRPRLWLLFGLVAGLGLLTKLTMLYFGLAVFVAVLLTPARRHLLTPWPWLGGAIALLFLLPYVFWEVSHGWPTLEFWASYGGKVDEASPLEFLIEQIVTMQPPTLPLWLAGALLLPFSRDGRPYRALGWIYVVLFVLFVVQNALLLPGPAYRCSSRPAPSCSSASWRDVTGTGSSHPTSPCWWSQGS